MPITVDADLRRPTQAEFGAIAYEVMEAVFAVRKELGRFLREEIYHRAIEQRVSDARSKVLICVAFDDFVERYFIDLLVANAAPFELKTVENLAPRHQAQLINYLLLTDLPPGKLVNLRAESVEHEFANSTLRRADRTDFEIDARDWMPDFNGRRDVRPWLTAALRDWGAWLDLQLYENACTHFYGGRLRVLGTTVIVLDGRPLGEQPVRLAAPDVAFKITALAPDAWPRFEHHARRFLAHSSLAAIDWINVTHRQLRFTTMSRK